MKDRKVTRSRAYPVLDLEAACKILRERLGKLGPAPIEREDLARQLGYTSGAGGGAARKIASLVHYGFLRRGHAGSYRLDRLGFQILSGTSGSPETAAALRSALEQPALFRSILDTYRVQGRLPLDLERILSEEHGITENAREDAASVFVQSAIFAGVLDSDRATFLPTRERSRASEAAVDSSREENGAATGPNFQIPLTQFKNAWLLLPHGVTDEDLQEIDEWWQKFGIPKLRKHLGLDVNKPARFEPRVVSSKDKSLKRD